MKLIHRYLLAGFVLIGGFVLTLAQWLFYEDNGRAIATGAGVLMIVFLLTGDE